MRPVAINSLSMNDCSPKLTRFTPAATQALIALASPENDRALREKAAFWLANERGHEGFVAIQRMGREDKDAAFREKLAFDLTLTKDPDAVKELVRMAQAR